MSESYTDFAQVYDELMDETPYELWKERIVGAIEEFGISKPIKNVEDMPERAEVSEEELLESERNLVVDLGCGTGTLTEMLYAEGYDMIGIDMSDAMLEKAMDKKAESGSEILYLCQDMRELELYSTVGTVISVCDSINYLTEEDDVSLTLGLIHNYLYPGGLFIFDFNTDYKYREVIGDTTIAENREDCSFIWENFYDPDEKINEYDLTIFVEEKGGLFRKFSETHFQKGYDKQQMEEMLIAAGFEIVKMIDSDTENEADDESERIFVIARCIKD